MRRKSLLALGILVAILGVLCIAAYFVLKHEPSFYRVARMPEGPERLSQSRESWTRIQSLMNAIKNEYPDWWEILTTEQINGFLQEDFIHSFNGDVNLPDGFHDLRVQIEEGKIRLGVRYGTGFWSTILSIDLKIWLVANEVNMVALEIANLRAGGLSISRQVIIDNITEAARLKNIDVNWYHHDGNPVAIMKLQADRMRPTIQLQRLDLQPGKIVIVGRSPDSNLGRPAGKPAN
jgi:hypothetical protein